MDQLCDWIAEATVIATASLVSLKIMSEFPEDGRTMS